MATSYQKLAEVEKTTTLSTSNTLLVEKDGEVQRAPVSLLPLQEATDTAKGLMSATDKGKLDAYPSSSKDILVGAVELAASAEKIDLSYGTLNGTYPVQTNPTTTTLPAATTAAAGLMSATDKAKLDGITTSLVILTQDEYDALETKDDTTVYFIKD